MSIHIFKFFLTVISLSLLASCFSGGQKIPMNQEIPEDITPPDDDNGGDDSGGGSDDDDDDGDDGDDRYTSIVPKNWFAGYKNGQGQFVQDYSYAGYHYGQEMIFTGVRFNVIDYGADPSGQRDSSRAIAEILKDIERVNSRSIIYFPAGRYLFEKPIDIQRPKVTIVGAGTDQTFLHLLATNGDRQSGIIFRARELSKSRDVAIRGSLEVFAKNMTVDDITQFQKGQHVEISIEITEDFLARHHMEDFWSNHLGRRVVFFRRFIDKIDPMKQAVVLDRPIRYDLHESDKPQLRVVSGHMEECGMRDLSISDVSLSSRTQRRNGNNMVEVVNAQNCYFENISGHEPYTHITEQVQSNGFSIRQSQLITLKNMKLHGVQNREPGGNGALFYVEQSQEVLFQDVHGTYGRHNFMVSGDFNTSGCVFHKIYSARSLATDYLFGAPVTAPSSSMFQSSLALANLVDESVIDDGWTIINGGQSSSHSFPRFSSGHGGTQNTFWNTDGAGYILSYQYGEGYIVGTNADLRVVTETARVIPPLRARGTLPDDEVLKESERNSLLPGSLYLFQKSLRQ